MPGFSNVVEGKILDHLTGKAAYPSPAPLSLALCTVAVTEADTALTMYGTCPSVQISTTQTPPTIAAGGVSMTLD
jgi:hypothetical protein